MFGTPRRPPPARAQIDDARTQRAADRAAGSRYDTRRYLPHAVLATAFVVGLPAGAVWAFVPSGSGALLVASVPLAILVSVAAAGAGAAFWMRRPGSRDLVFADLMLWGWVRRLLAERRLAQAREVLGLGGAGHDVSADRRVAALRHLTEHLEAADPDTYGHTRRVTRHAERIARAMHLPPEEIARVRTAAALHDVGKLLTPPEILLKPGALTDAEFAVIERHPVDGAAMVAAIEDPAVTAMVRHHHERLDGAGYPDGLAGEAIPLGARIIAVADTFDAITSARAYHGPRTHKWALDILAGEAGDRLDAAAVSAFLGYYSGRRAVALSALVAAMPQRVTALAGSGSRGLSTGTTTIAHALPAVGAAALIAGPLAAAPQTRADAAEGRPRTPSRAHTAVVARAPAAAAPLRRAGSASASRAPRRRVGLVLPEDPPVARVPGPATPAASHDAGPAPAALPTPEPSAPRLPAAEPPAAAPPQAHVPQVELPRVELPHVELPHVELPHVELPHVELPAVDVPPLPGLDAPAG
jgi:putative nucleotidyltransferase with HDIG domain